MYNSNMEFNTVDDVRRDIELKSQIKKAGQSAPENFKNLDQTVSNIFKSPGAGKLSDISYTAGFGNVYERGRDGNYYAKYENYLGAFGNEDRLGREQGAGEQLWNGFVKNLAKTGLYAIDGTVGTIVGLTKAISDGDMKSLWDNDFTDAMDYASKSLDRDLPNYYTDEQKSSNFFGKLFTANFLGNDFLNGLAFVGGAVLPQVILGTLTGGASLAVNTAKLGGKLAYSSAKRFGTSSLRNSLRVGTKVGKGTGELLNTGKFIAQSTFFEAGMEARHNFHDSIENWTTEYFNTYGKLPSSEEAEKYLSAAETGANSVFWGNVGVLSLTNASMFGKVFGLGKLTLPGTKTFNKMIGLGVESVEKGGLRAIAPTKLQKVLGNAYFIGRKPVSEGLVEEGTQGVITKMADTYTKAKYEGDDSYSFTQNLVDALGQQYGTKEGWNEIGVGMLVGAVGGNISGNFGIEGIIGKNSETFSKAVKGLQEKVDNRESQLETFRNLNRTNSMFNANIDNTQKEDGLESTQLYQDVVSNHSYIKANTPLKGYTDMTEDFDAVVDSLEITDDQLTDSGLESIDDYKTLMKDQFRTDLDSYKKANSFVRNLGLSNLKISKGNVVETEDALTLSFMMGEKSEEQARKIAGNIESLTGLSGVHSSLKFFETLNTTQLDNINKLKVQQDNLTKLENEIIKVQSSIEEQKASGADKTNITNLSKKYAVISRQIDNLNSAITSTKETLNNDFDSIRASDATINEDFSNIDDVLETVEKIRSFSKGLRKVGRDQDAKTLDNYVEQFSVFSQTSIDSKLTFDQMLNTNFFSSKGGGSLLKSITGEDYDFSKESIDSIRAIESQLVDKASQFGYAVGNTEEFLEQLRNNENLSEREKYKIESIARVLSAQTSADERSKQLQDNFDNVVPEETIVTNDVEEITVTSPNIVGDTIQISDLVNINPTTSEQLKALVDEIASLTDQIVNKPTSYQLSELNKKRQQLENLNQELNSVRNQINLEGYAISQQGTGEIFQRQQEQIGETGGERRRMEQEFQGQETPQESQEEKIDELVDDILINPEQTDTDFAIKMLEEAIEYETTNEFGSTELANEYETVLNNLKDGKINVNEIGDFLNKTTSGEDTNSSRTGSETIRTKNGDIKQIPQTNQESLVKKEARIKEEIVGIEEEIYDLERPFKFSETSEYKEFKKLLSIPEEDRSEDQEVRINELRGDINDWILTMGTQTNGILFSDIVEQMVALDNISVTETPTTINITDAEVDENQNTISLANKQNLKVALNFGAVTSTFKKNNTGEIFTEIANISLSGLEDVSGVLLDGFEGVALNPTTNAIQLSDEIVESINSVGKIHISTSTENVTTSYNPVRQATATLSGDINYNILKTDFYDEYEGEIIDDEDIYNLKQGQELFAYVDPNDPYNKSILDRLSSELGIMSESDIEATVEKEIKLYKTIQLTSAQNKLRILLNSPKRDQAKIKDQEGFIQELLNSQKERIRKRLTGRRKTTISPDLISEIKSKLKIMLTNKDGDNVSVLKGSRTIEEIERLDASKLQTIRDIFADDIGFLTKLIESPSVELKSIGLKVDNVLPGFPNYFISKNTDGTLVREARELSPQQIEKIYDIGFISNGKLETRIGSSNIDTTFVGRQLSEKNSSRVPVAIIKRGEKLIAYPLIVSSDLPTVTSEDMESIYNSELPETEKAIRLNELLARAGVNVQEVGNAFVVVGDQKINSDFFNQKVAQVENITYLRNVDNFLDGRIPKEEILRSGVSININLSEPFISPKIKLDFSNIVAKEVSNENLRSKSKKTVSSVMSQLAMDRQKVCK